MGCPVINYRVHFDTRVPEIQVSGGEGWIKLHSSSDLPYPVASGLTFRRFAKIRHDMMAAGEKDPIVPEVPTPPEDSTTSDDHGGVLHGPGLTSTPGECFTYFVFLFYFSLFSSLSYIFYFSERSNTGVAPAPAPARAKGTGASSWQAGAGEEGARVENGRAPRIGVDQSGENTILRHDFSAMETTQLNK